MKKNILTIILCLFTLAAAAQTRQIKGKITASDDNSALGGVFVSQVGGSNGTSSDANGNYTITITGRTAQLKFQYLGYEALTINVTENKDVYDVVLNSTIQLDEVVITTAGGIVRTPRQPGFATTQVTAAELTAGKSANIAAGLTARVPGLQVNAISSGVNPTFRLVLRGNRSINGDNTALIVVDGAIVNSLLLGNLNPQDIENIQVLNGASGATLYGSEASNGVLIITTKKGLKGKPKITLSHSLMAEQISFFPKMQNTFGQGTTADAQVFDRQENQQYGPAFDGTLRELGNPLANGEQQYTPYVSLDDRKKFWETGLQNQTDFSLRSGTDNSTTYISAGYLDVKGTTPFDKYNRISIRLNNTQKLLPNLNVSYSVSYLENNYDTSTATSDIYENLIQVPANIPIKNYKDYKNDKWADLEGWFNPWYENPYYMAGEFRQDTKNTYLTGNAEIKYDITSWLSVLYRASLTNRYYQTHQWDPKYTYTDWGLSVHKKANLAGSIYDGSTNYYRLNQDFQLSAKHDFNDISLNLILGGSNVNKNEKSSNVGASGLVIPYLYNIGNRSGDVNTNTSATTIHSRNYGVWADFLAGYKNYAFLHVTGRNDWTSVLSKENQSYFYPSVDVSFIPSDAIASLNESNFLDYWKLRAAWSKTGNVNINPYALSAIYDSSTGWNKGGTYFTESGTLVSNNLKPEITTGYEFGTEFWINNRFAELQFTYYATSTTGEAISASVATSTGYSNLLLNSGEVTNKGIEASLRLNPVHTRDWTVSFGGNFTHNENVLKELMVDRIGVNGSSVVFAQVGQPINVIIVSDYNRVPDDYPDKSLVGKVIVDKNTGYPSASSETKIQGNTIPKYRVGLDFNVKYKNVSLSSVVEYRGGYSYASISMGTNMDFAGASARSAYYNRERFVFPNSAVLVDGKYEANNNITISDGGVGFWTSGTYNRSRSSNYVYSGDYWKWREVALTYDLPSSFLRKATYNVIQAASFSLQGRNLFLWVPKSNEYTDPDYSANDNNAIGVSTLTTTPPTRYFGGTLSITF